MEKLDKKNIEDILKLTPMQEGMLFHYLKNPANNHYFEQLSLDITGKIELTCFEQAWNFVIKTNEMLRTIFRWEEVENPIQIILKEHKLQPIYYDFPGKEHSEKKKQWEEIKNEDKKKKFDLRNVPFRVTLAKIDKEKHGMVISNHHILYDGWSSGIILKEFLDAYIHFFNGKEPVKPVKTRFKEFVKLQKKRNSHKKEEFWKNYLKGAETEANSLIEMKPKKLNKTRHPGTYQIQLSKEMKERLEGFAKKYKIPLSSLLYCAWGILLQKYHSSNDVRFDVTVSGRIPGIKGLEDMVGLFINTLPMRVQAGPAEKIMDVLMRISGILQHWEEYAHSISIPIKEFIDRCYRQTLFDSVMVIENYPLNRRFLRGNDQLRIDSFSLSGMTVYDITIIITLFDDITVNFSCNEELFDEKAGSVLGNHFISIVDEIAAYPQHKISQAGQLMAKEKDKILYKFKREKRTGFNGTPYAAPGNKVEKKLVEIWSDLLHLEKSSVGIDANFFEFGGHSLKAAVLVSEITKEFKVKVPLAEVFKRATIRKLSRYIKKVTDKEGKFAVIEPAEKREYYPLSSAQKRIYTLQQMDLESIAYNGPCVMAIEGELDKRRVENIFWQLINKHESLRTSFKLVEDTPVQKIDETGKLDMEYCSSNEQAAEEILLKAVKPFNLEKLPLMRVSLLEAASQRHILFVDMHHIITDGASMEILINQFIMLYQGIELSPSALQYKDYSLWRNSKQEIDRIKKQEMFWWEQFKSEIPRLNLPSDFSRSTARSSAGSVINFEIGKKQTQRLRKMDLEKGVTLYMLLLAVYSILLSKYTGQQDIVIGAVTSGRTHESLQDIIGAFTNFLAMRTYPGENKTFRDFLVEIKHYTLDAFENQDYYYEELIKRLNLKRNPGKDPLIEAAFTVQNMDPDEIKSKTTRKDAPFKMIPLEFDPGTTKWALDLFATEYGQTIGMTLVYSTDLFRKSTARMITKHFIELLEQVLDNETIVLKDIKIYYDLSYLKSKRVREEEGDFIF